MAVNLKVTLGTVNYTDFLHVTASKVATPGVVAWETWINVPVSDYEFVIPNLDPENYYIRYYDAPTNVALGTLVSELIVNALTSEFTTERRFYTCGGAGTYDPADGDMSITDPYFIGKTLTGVFKEGFRYYDLDTETTFDDVTGEIAVIIGNAFSELEKIIVELKYAAGTVASSSAGLYVGTLNVTEATKTLIASDRNKRIRCVGSGSTQVITLAALSALAIEDGFYFDNSCGGTAVQVKLLLPGGDRIKYNGFMAASDEFAEFWVSKGEHLLIRKFDDDYWEVIADYKGVEVGRRSSDGYVGMPGSLPEDGALKDGDEYPRLWWWINNILPSTHVITDDTVTSGGYVHPAAKVGLFVKHSTLKKFRMPNTQSMSEKGLKNFNSYGSDASRAYDYPKGFQEQANLKHRHFVANGNSGTSSTALTLANKLNFQNETSGINDFKYTFSGSNTEATIGLTSESGGDYNIVNNIAVIYSVRI